MFSSKATSKFAFAYRCNVRSLNSRFVLLILARAFVGAAAPPSVVLWITKAGWVIAALEATWHLHGTTHRHRHSHGWHHASCHWHAHVHLRLHCTATTAATHAHIASSAALEPATTTETSSTEVLHASHLGAWKSPCWLTVERLGWGHVGTGPIVTITATTAGIEISTTSASVSGSKATLVVVVSSKRHTRVIASYATVDMTRRTILW